jgi:Ca2+/Na+ antiporter
MLQFPCPLSWDAPGFVDPTGMGGFCATICLVVGSGLLLTTLLVHADEYTRMRIGIFDLLMVLLGLLVCVWAGSVLRANLSQLLQIILACV